MAYSYTWRYNITVGVLYGLQVRVHTPTPYQGCSERPTSTCTGPYSLPLRMTSVTTYAQMTSLDRVLKLRGFCIVFPHVHPRALQGEVSIAPVFLQFVTNWLPLRLQPVQYHQSVPFLVSTMVVLFGLRCSHVRKLSLVVKSLPSP